MINARELGKRLIFCAWGIPVGWWIINSTIVVLPKSLGNVLPGQIAALMLVILACYEYIKMLAVSFPRNGFWLSYLWIISFLSLDLIGQSVPMKFAIFILLIMVAFEAIAWGDKNTGRWKRASLLFSAIVFLYIAGISLLNFYQEPFQSFFRHFPHPMLSQIGIIMIILSVFYAIQGPTSLAAYGENTGTAPSVRIKPSKEASAVFSWRLLSVRCAGIIGVIRSIPGLWD